MSGALLFTLPLNQADFLSRVGASDYLKRFSIDPEGSWKLTYRQEVAEPWLALADVARQAGWVAIENAAIADLNWATKQFQTVVVVSHWKGPTILPEDLIAQNPKEYVAKVYQANSISAICLQKYFEQKPQCDMTDIYQNLVNFTKSSKAWDQHNGDDFEVKASLFTIESWNRDEIDNLFGAFIRPGNRIEFADGLYDKESVKDAIDINFQGLLDLTTCTSTVLSDYLVRISRGRFNTIQFEKPQKPALTGLLLERTFQLCAEGLNYKKARVKAYKDLVEGFETLESVTQPQNLLTRLKRKLINIWRRKGEQTSQYFEGNR